VFNGDADGLFALHQLRLSRPLESELVTGAKREIDLLQHVRAHAGDYVLVLDLSLHANRAALRNLLAGGVRVCWFDHHYAGDIPEHENLEAHIDTAAERCTSLLVNEYLRGAHLPWAVAAAFGDNLHDAARRAAAPLHLREEPLQRLRLLGECVNYNSYGLSQDDLLFHPADLYRRLAPYSDPFDFMAEEDVFPMLREGMESDLGKARRLRPEFAEAHAALYLLPDAPWARRASGLFGNELARMEPDRAHAVLLPLKEGGWRVSVRAPLGRGGADRLCRAFPSGGGRTAAAGINRLPAEMFDAFVERFRSVFGG
jgi:hypothetical protein